MRAMAAITALALAGGAFALGRATGPDATSTARERVIDRMVAVPSGGACVARLGDDDLRRLRDEIVATLPAPAAAPVPDEVAPPPTTAQATAADATARLLDRAVAAGRWTDDDAVAMRDDLAAMDPAQMTATLQRMAALVNGGRLRVETTGSPF